MSVCVFVPPVGWVNELVGGQHAGAKGFMFFGVNVDLTENGIGIATQLLFFLSLCCVC